jgi:hypothetical protein
VVQAPKKSSAKPKPKQPKATTPDPSGFGPPSWLNVLPEPIPISPTLDDEVARAVEQRCAGNTEEQVRAIADRAPIDDLIAMFTGPALTSGRPYWDEARVAALSLGEKRAQKKVYWAAESAKNLREGVHVWLVGRLATTPAGRAHLLSIAAGDHSARLRGFAAQGLREPADAALWREIAERLDPCGWIGTIDNTSSTWLGHTYAVGATGALITDPAGALSRFAPLLDANVAASSDRARYQATSILWGFLHLLRDLKRDPTPYAGFTPLVLELIGIPDLKYPAMFALVHLPFTPEVADAAARDLGPSPTEVTYWADANLDLIARSSDPRYVPWLAHALASSWMHWSRTFRGLANIGDPIGIAIIEAWLVDNAASDRTAAAAPVLEALRAKGEPTDAQRAEAAAYFAPKPKKKRKR